MAACNIVSYTTKELIAMRERGETRTDWEQVRENVRTNAPIPYDPEEDPYDPNDDAAVDAFWAKARVVALPNRIPASPPQSGGEVQYPPDLLQAG